MSKCASHTYNGTPGLPPNAGPERRILRTRSLGLCAPLLTGIGTSQRGVFGLAMRPGVATAAPVTASANSCARTHVQVSVLAGAQVEAAASSAGVSTAVHLKVFGVRIAFCLGCPWRVRVSWPAQRPQQLSGFLALRCCRRRGGSALVASQRSGCTLRSCSKSWQ